MRGHRLHFVLAAVAALGLIGFASFDRGRDTVTDAEASQFVGGAGCVLVGLQSCGSCNGTCYCGSGGTWVWTIQTYCGGSSACNMVYNNLGCVVSTGPPGP